MGNGLSSKQKQKKLAVVTILRAHKIHFKSKLEEIKKVTLDQENVATGK